MGRETEGRRYGKSRRSQVRKRRQTGGEKRDSRDMYGQNGRKREGIEEKRDRERRRRCEKEWRESEGKGTGSNSERSTMPEGK